MREKIVFFLFLFPIGEEKYKKFPSGGGKKNVKHI
jgi:hypothetical protein